MIYFQKDLLTLNTAYNNSIVQFSSSTVSNPTKCVIEVDGVQFIAVPNAGTFTFNFKEIVKSLVNTNRFEDTIIPDLTETYVYDDSTITKDITVKYTVHNLNSNESITRNYKFVRGVEQLPNYHRLTSITTSIRLLLPTENFTDYNVRFFEGYPFDFGIYGLKANDTYYFKNITTNQNTTVQVCDNSDVKRVFISDGANNTTDTDILVQSSTLNKIELWVNGVFRCNLYINKVESDCGVYLKWLNSKGSYSYWKLDPIFKSSISSRTIDEISGRYDNLQNVTSLTNIIGKTANKTLTLNTVFNAEDAEYLSDLGTSPAVWMYVHNTPFNQQQPYDFIGVKVNDTAFTYDNKRSKNKMSITLTLPVNTITQ